MNKYTNHSQSKYLRWIFQFTLVRVLGHWVVQGILGMDPTERTFKIFIDVILTIFFGIILNTWLTWKLAFLVAFLIAHSLNFLLNAQLWFLLRHYEFASHTPQTFNAYSQGIADRIKDKEYLAYAGIYGSVTKLQWKPSSDLDLRLVATQGLNNRLQACIFVLTERTRALIYRFPLDVLLVEHFELLNNHLRVGEQPIVWLDRRVIS